MTQSTTDCLAQLSEIWPASLFVMVLGASSYTYAEATASLTEKRCFDALFVPTFR
jgi:hypothetical protein